MLQNLTRQVKATMGIFESRDEDDVYGLLAEFSNPSTLMHAAESVRERGYRHFDAHSPFPIHGMDRAMGLSNSKVGYFTLGGGATGLIVGYALQWWTAAVDYPLNISGKPLFAVESAIPIIFEVVVLFSAFGAVAGMLALNGLPRPYNPLFYSERFEKVTDDGFFLHIAASDTQFDQDKTANMLRDIGALNVELIKDDGTADA